MRIRAFLLSVVLALSVGAPLAIARPSYPVVAPNWVLPAQDRQRGQREIRPLREVIEELRARHGGEFIELLQLEQGPRPTYVIRWRLPDGRVRDFRVPAER